MDKLACIADCLAFQTLEGGAAAFAVAAVVFTTAVWMYLARDSPSPRRVRRRLPSTITPPDAALYQKEVDVDAEFFKSLDRIRQSKEFMLETANVLHRAYCAVMGLPCEEIQAFEKERVAATYSPIPAMLACTSYLALQRSIPNGSPVKITRDVFLDTLRTLSHSDYMDPSEYFLVGLFSHSTWTAGLPYRDMLTSDFGHLSRPSNQSFFTLSKLDQMMTIVMVARAARLLLEKLDVPMPPSDGDPGPLVFLGGACNPTTWRRDIAIPMLEQAGITYYNPQVEEWSPDLVPLEAAAKASCPYLIFVINNETRGLTSMIEATEFVSSRKKVFLVVEDVGATQELGGVPVNKVELADINRGRAYLRDVARRHATRIFSDVEVAVAALVDEVAATRGLPADRPAKSH